MTKKDKLVYDECAEECARKMKATFKLYSGCDVSVIPLATWSREQSQLSLPENCKTVFIVHGETDEFLSTILCRFKEFYETTFIVVIDSKLQAGRVACAEIKSAFKHLNVDNTEEKKRALDRTIERAKERIITIKNVWDDADCWVPKVIMFMFPSPEKHGNSRHSPVKNGKSRRNVSVFFEIDPNNDAQIRWMDKQRKVLEADMKLTCRYNDGDHSATEPSKGAGDRSETILDTYRKNSECVVMYVGAIEDLLGISSFRETYNKKISAVNDRVKVLCEQCIDVETKLIVFVENESNEMIKKFDDNQNLYMVGTNGAFTYWVGLLSALGKVNIPRKPDDLFHSDVTHEEVKKPRFNPATLSDMTTQTPIPNTRSTTSVSDDITARNVEFTAVRHPSQLPEIGPEKYVIGVTYQMKLEVTQSWLGQREIADIPSSCFPYFACLRPSFK